MNTRLIRSYLQHGHIAEASQLFLAEAPADLQRRAMLLYAQFTTLESRDTSGPAPGFGHFRLLYSAFHLVSLYEARHCREGATARRLACLERDLTTAYRRLAALGRQSLIDRFMRWMIKHQPARFYELVQREKLAGGPADMARLLAEFDLEAFRRHAAIRMPLALLRQLLCERGRETPDFFCHWLDQAAYRIRYTKMLLEAVEQSRQLHAALLNDECEVMAQLETMEEELGGKMIGEVMAQFEKESL